MSCMPISIDVAGKAHTRETQLESKLCDCSTAVPTKRGAVLAVQVGLQWLLEQHPLPAVTLPGPIPMPLSSDDALR